MAKKRLSRLNTNITTAGEVPNDILEKLTISDKANEEAIKLNDNDIVEVVAKIPASTSTRKWNYTEGAIKDVVNSVIQKTSNGFKGHQKPEDVSNKFPPIATHWTGAYYDENTKTGYIKGIVDKGQQELKDWIKADRINQVSIFGKPTLKKTSNGIDVTNYDLMSIDWTPLNRAGMATEVYKIASGEMAEVFNDSFDKNDFISGELDGSHEETHEALRTACNNYFGVDENKYIYIRKTFENYAIIKLEEYNPKASEKIYRIEYTINNDIINITKSEEVKIVESYEPISSGGEMNNNEGVEEVDEKEKLRLQSLNKIFGEMSIEEIQAINDKANEAKKEEENKINGEMIKECLNEKVKNEKVIDFINSTYKFEGTTKELVNGEIDKILENELVKTFINSNGIPPKGQNNDSNVDGIKYTSVSIS